MKSEGRVRCVRGEVVDGVRPEGESRAPLGEYDGETTMMSALTRVEHHQWDATLEERPVTWC